ncbi:Ypt/Rab-GAP domain of gyp1p superfamily protein isoform 2 [Hibiscus syriacus]|uniref:Ypt/Rab-GAP domain of gyp1p superfamily protein isoform 2 n=1 Tax=Hibiscus syriacus TaxID=106335 RepID=A0A6A2XGR3_HIBSY|nr:Ypt/Rab-GAP domain of gyp1p superfamily protein isoform 2 [Hibiscus syriacus]
MRSSASTAISTTTNAVNPLITFDLNRDAYGFAVRPQHVQRYREYANIYKEEEEERSDRWSDFLDRQAESAQFPCEGIPSKEGKEVSHAEAAEDGNNEMQKGAEGDDLYEKKSGSDSISENNTEKEKKKDSSSKDERETDRGKPLAPTEDARFLKGASEEDSEDEFYDAERSDSIQDSPTSDSGSTTISAAAVDAASIESLFPWKEELEVLVRGGVPMALRGELWQTFVGVRTLRQNYYQDLLANEITSATTLNNRASRQLTFPGHPALDDDGRNALRRLLTAYARHNPSVGYCQAMNFFAALLLLLMPEENAFWTLVGIIDDYFDGYYSEEMIESQIIWSACGMGYWTLVPFHFMNMLPWESGQFTDAALSFSNCNNPSLSFLMGFSSLQCFESGMCSCPALVTTKDAGDAVTLLQSLAGSTFDSSQLVLTACMGYQNVNEKRLQELRERHRSAVITSVEERSKGLQAWKDFQGLASKLYNFNHDPKSMLMETNRTGQLVDLQTNVDLSSSESGSMNEDKFLVSNWNAELDAIPDLQEQNLTEDISLKVIQRIHGDPVTVAWIYA